MSDWDGGVVTATDRWAYLGVPMDPTLRVRVVRRGHAVTARVTGDRDEATLRLAATTTHGGQRLVTVLLQGEGYRGLGRWRVLEDADHDDAANARRDYARVGDVGPAGRDVATANRARYVTLRRRPPEEQALMLATAFDAAVLRRALSLRDAGDAWEG